MMSNNWLRKELQQLPLSVRIELLNEWLEELFQAFHFDIIAEVLAVHLIENGLVDIENLLILPTGTFKRAFRKDVADLYCREVANIKKEAVFMPIHREGIYDTLPEALFHIADDGGKTNKSTKEMCDESKLLRAEEKEARLFFLPFEQAIYKLRLYLEQQTNTAITKISNFKELKKFWGILPECNQQQSLILLYTLPIAHNIVGNLALIENCFSSILNKEIEICYGKTLPHLVEDTHFLPLGEFTLGKNMLLKGSFNEYIPSLEITIKSVAVSELTSYLEEGENYKILHFLYAYFLPAEVEVITHIQLQKKDKGFSLSEKTNSNYLGFDTYI